MRREYKKSLIELVNRAQELGLSSEASIAAKEYIEYNEYGVGFELVLSQLYEFEISIDKEFYLMLVHIAKELKLPPEDYLFMEELISTRLPKR